MSSHEFVRLFAKEPTRFNVRHFMKLAFFTELVLTLQTVLRLADVFGFLQMTLLMNNFAHPCTIP